MFFDPFSSWLVSLISTGLCLADERSKSKKTDQYLRIIEEEKARREAAEPFWGEPHRDSENGKIIIENSQLYNEDCKKYGAYQASKWVQRGKYNLTPEELEKEKERIREKYRRLYEL